MVKRTSIKSLAAFLFWEPLLTAEKQAALSRVPCPAKVLGVKVPRTLDGLTFEGLARFWDCKTSAELYAVIADVILHKSPARIMRAKPLPLIGLGNMVAAELKRIAELWESMPPAVHSPEEIMAGCQRLNFGVFGMADWYARRMGITDHDQAMQTPWVRVYQCMRNDAEVAAYERRLNDIYNNKHKIK